MIGSCHQSSKQIFCDFKPLLELTDSLINSQTSKSPTDSQTSQSWEVLLEFIDTPIHSQTYYNWELLSKLFDSQINTCTSCSWEPFLEYAYSPIDAQSLYNWELLSELIDPPMDIQIFCNCKLFSELIDSNQHTNITQLEALSEPTDSLIDTHSSDDDLLTRRLLMHVSRAVQGCLSEQHLPFIRPSNILLYHNFFFWATIAMIMVLPFFFLHQITAKVTLSFQSLFCLVE